MLDFEYRITSKHNVSVITFIGKISKESRDQLETCRQEMLEDKSKMVIIYFKDVSNIDPCVFREFTLLQQEIRKKNAELFLAGLDTSVKQYLVDRAVIRLGEVKKSLQEVFEEKLKTA